jgi:hypothetical protein
MGLAGRGEMATVRQAGIESGDLMISVVSRIVKPALAPQFLKNGATTNFDTEQSPLSI